MTVAIETKNRILDAAERLFADFGYKATSLRDITSEAGVNLASVNYHFGSKEALLAALLERNFAPVNRRRIELLDALEASTDGATDLSLTTFFGLAPLMLERSFDAEFLLPMAVSLAFGVIFATFITLILVPTEYLILDDIGKGMRRLFGRDSEDRTQRMSSRRFGRTPAFDGLRREDTAGQAAQ